MHNKVKSMHCSFCQPSGFGHTVHYLLSCLCGSKACILLLYYRAARRGYIIPLRRFIESVFDIDLRCFPTEVCFEVSATPSIFHAFHPLHYSMY